MGLHTQDIVPRDAELPHAAQRQMDAPQFHRARVTVGDHRPHFASRKVRVHPGPTVAIFAGEGVSIPCASLFPHGPHYSGEARLMRRLMPESHLRASCTIRASSGK